MCSGLQNLRDRVDWKKMLSVVFTAVGIYLMAEVCRNLCYGAESEFQIHRDYFFYRASAFFLVMVALLRKVSIRRWQIPFVIITYAGYAIKYLIDHDNDYGPDYRALLIAKYVAEGLLLIIFVDVILTGKLSAINKQNKVYIIFAVLSIMCVYVLNYNFSRFTLFPMIGLFLTPLSRNQWKWLTDCLAVGYYLAFTWIMTRSLMDVPYRGGRYYGVFLNLYTGGAFASGALICCAYLLVRALRLERKCKIATAVCTVLFIYPAAAMMMIGARCAELGILVTILLAYVFMFGKEQCKKRAIKATVATALLVVCGMLFLFLLSHWEPDDVKESISNEYIAGKVAYWVGRGNTFMNAESKYDVVPSGSLINAIDRFSSDRISIAIESIRTNTLLGSSYIGVDTEKLSFMYPHNNYLTWLRAYGWIGGTPVVLWFFIGLTVSIRGILRKDDTVLFTFLWMTYCTGLFLADTMLWAYPVSFLLLLLQYPLLNAYTDNSSMSV